MTITSTTASLLVQDALTGRLPHKQIPDHGLGGLVASDLIRNQLLLDGSARLNLATFVTTWMPPIAAELMADTADKNMIGVVAILGSTFDGSYEPVTEIAEALDNLAATGGPDVPMHVDAASGGFIAPFVQPELVWDFQVPRVQSINASGHKYGLVYPG